MAMNWMGGTRRRSGKQGGDSAALLKAGFERFRRARALKQEAGMHVAVGTTHAGGGPGSASAAFDSFTRREHELKARGTPGKAGDPFATGVVEDPSGPVRSARRESAPQRARCVDGGLLSVSRHKDTLRKRSKMAASTPIEPIRRKRSRSRSKRSRSHCIADGGTPGGLTDLHAQPPQRYRSKQTQDMYQSLRRSLTREWRKATSEGFGVAKRGHFHRCDMVQQLVTKRRKTCPQSDKREPQGFRTPSPARALWAMAATS